MTSAFVYVTDARGFELTSHSAISLALSQVTPLNIYILCYRFVPEFPPGLVAMLAERGVTLHTDAIADEGLEQHRIYLHVTTPSLLKLSAVGKLISQYDRVIYLDSDILVFDDLKIADIEFGKAPIAAVVDMDLTETGALRFSRWSNGRGESEDLGSYFNSGFMVFEAKNWRGDEYYESYARALNQHDIACRYKLDCTSTDQCALNSVFENRWVELPVRYNMQAGAKFTQAWRTAAVRHYCGARKFVPVSLFRNDSRDVRLLNDIRHHLRLPTVPLPLLYQIPFLLNVARQRPKDGPMRQFLRALQQEPVASRYKQARSALASSMAAPSGS